MVTKLLSNSFEITLTTLAIAARVTLFSITDVTILPLDHFPKTDLSNLAPRQLLFDVNL